MKKIKKILWTTDGSEQSLNALKYARLIAKKFGARIDGYYVIRNIKKPIFNLLGVKIDFEKLYENERIKANEIFTKVKKDTKRDEIKFSTAFGLGNPANEIVKYAKNNKSDIIVMGKRGIGLFDTDLTGSVTNKVIQLSPVPVFISNLLAKKTRPNIKKILVPFNLNEDIVSSLDYAVFVAKNFNAAITIVYVEEYFTYPADMPVPILNDLRNYFNKKLDNLVNKYKTKGIKIDTKVIESVSIYLGVLRLSESLKPDLIIMNTHGRKGIKKYVLGSVAEKIIRDMPCPVITLRP